MANPNIYPSWRYHPDGRSVIVHTEEEDAGLEGFYESPAEFPQMGTMGPFHDQSELLSDSTEQGKPAGRKGRQSRKRE